MTLYVIAALCLLVLFGVACWTTASLCAYAKDLLDPPGDDS